MITTQKYEFMPERENVTRLLIELSNGNNTVIDALLPVVYDELKKLAASYLRRERAAHTLQATALVHEAYIKLIDQTQSLVAKPSAFFRRRRADYAADFC